MRKLWWLTTGIAFVLGLVGFATLCLFQNPSTALRDADLLLLFSAGVGLAISLPFFVAAITVTFAQSKAGKNSVPSRFAVPLGVALAIAFRASFAAVPWSPWTLLWGHFPDALGFGLIGLAAWMIRERGIWPNAMLGTLWGCAAGTVLSLIAYWPDSQYLAQPEVPKVIFLAGPRLLLKFYAVSLLWAGIVFLPKFSGWRQWVSWLGAMCVIAHSVALSGIILSNRYENYFLGQYSNLGNLYLVHYGFLTLAWLCTGLVALLALTRPKDAHAPDTCSNGGRLRHPSMLLSMGVVFYLTCAIWCKGPYFEGRSASHWIEKLGYSYDSGIERYRQVPEAALRAIGPSAVPMAITMLEDKRGDVHRWVIGALMLWGPDSSSAVPYLMRSHASADEVYGSIGPAAAAALPMLEKKLTVLTSEPSSCVPRLRTAYHILRIAPHHDVAGKALADAAVEVFADTSLVGTSPWVALSGKGYFLRSIEAAAKAAIPILTERTNTGSPARRESAKKTLDAIGQALAAIAPSAGSEPVPPGGYR